MTIIDFSAIERAMIEASVSVEAPVLIHSLGIPGCGKSSLFGTLGNIWRTENIPFPTLLGFDQVMQSHPDYQLHPDKIAAFGEYEIPARSAGYRILDGLIAKRSHILFDNGGSAESHRQLLKRAQNEYGYRLIFISVITPISVARMRVNARAEETGQHTPMQYLEERFDKLQKLIPDYRAMTEYFYEIDNSANDFQQYIADCQIVSASILENIKKPPV